jgi:hypothetical protein
LKVAAHEAEEESDNIAEDFLEGKTEIDDFLSSFMEKRTVCNIFQLMMSDNIVSNYLSVLMSKRLSTLLSWNFECCERTLKRRIATPYYHCKPACSQWHKQVSQVIVLFQKCSICVSFCRR